MKKPYHTPTLQTHRLAPASLVCSSPGSETESVQGPKVYSKAADDSPIW